MERLGACIADAGQAYEAMNPPFFTWALDGLLKGAGLNLQEAERLPSIFDPNDTLAPGTKNMAQSKKQGGATIFVLSTWCFASHTGGAIG